MHLLGKYDKSHEGVRLGTGDFSNCGELILQPIGNFFSPKKLKIDFKNENKNAILKISSPNDFEKMGTIVNLIILFFYLSLGGQNFFGTHLKTYF